MNKKCYEQGSYGEYLVALIKQHNFSQSEFARRINVSRTYLFDLLNGRVKPPAPEMQERIVKVLELKGQEKDEIFSISAGKRLTKADMDSGQIPFIGATDSNNGITNWIATPNSSFDKNVLGVNYNGSVVENFYHPYCCVFSDDVKRLHLKKYTDNKYILLFFKTVILQQKVKYTYGYKFNGQRMERQKILLPINERGDPDYEFMRQYGEQIMLKKYQQYLNYIST